MSYLMSSSEAEATVHVMFSVTVLPLVVTQVPAELLSLFVARDRVDVEARRLSMMLPNVQVVIATLSRVKATYVNGKRTLTHDFRVFYDNLTDEQYKNTQFLCSETHQYV